MTRGAARITGDELVWNWSFLNIYLENACGYIVVLNKRDIRGYSYTTQLSCCVMEKRQGWTEKIGFSIFDSSLVLYLFMLLSCNTPTDIRTLRIPVLIAHAAILTHSCSPSFVIECRSASLCNVLILEGARSRATNVQHRCTPMSYVPSQRNLIQLCCRPC